MVFENVRVTKCTVLGDDWYELECKSGAYLYCVRIRVGKEDITKLLSHKYGNGRLVPSYG